MDFALTIYMKKDDDPQIMIFLTVCVVFLSQICFLSSLGPMIFFSSCLFSMFSLLESAATSPPSDAEASSLVLEIAFGTVLLDFLFDCFCESGLKFFKKHQIQVDQTTNLLQKH